jgi:transcriptional activator of cad operon
MEHQTTTVIRIGAWLVDPNSGQISRNGEITRLDGRTMRLLLCLAEHVGEVVSIDDLLAHVWNGVTVTPDSVYQAVTSLRRSLGDDPKQPTYIATVPRYGYRMVAAVTPWETSTKSVPDPKLPSNMAATTSEPTVSKRFPASLRTRFMVTACAIVCVGLLLGTWLFLMQGKTSTVKSSGPAVPIPATLKSLAVLPFLDLTEGMKQGEFTDGLTEELIDKLSKVPGLRVPSPTSSFYFKDKQISVAEVAGKLGVAYVLDGSVRKQGPRVRVAARLVRADTGYVIWSQTFDRPWHYTLMVQDDIAAELTKAVEASFGEPNPPRR